MKTIKEWLMELPEPVRSRALKYEIGFNDVHICLTAAIGTAFTWAATKEGSDYWGYVALGY